MFDIFADIIAIPDKDIYHYWYCPECKDVETVHPDFYEENGTPVCIECVDQDMSYDRTIVQIKKG